eukprot:scaffold653_cov345-Pavlova_lutheri.AAC.9
MDARSRLSRHVAGGWVPRGGVPPPFLKERMNQHDGIIEDTGTGVVIAGIPPSTLGSEGRGSGGGGSIPCLCGFRRRIVPRLLGAWEGSYGPGPRWMGWTFGPVPTSSGHDLHVSQRSSTPPLISKGRSPVFPVSPFHSTQPLPTPWTGGE